MAAPLIWINGYPGTGKLTVATALKKLNKSIVLIDNHQLIDPVEAEYSRSHPEYQRQRQIRRKEAFIQHVSSPDSLSQTVVFTDFQTTNKQGESVAKEYQQAALEAARPFLPIYMTCDEQENIKRVCSKERVDSDTTKLTDRHLLQTFRSSTAIYRFQDCVGLSIDVTDISSEEAASQIAEHIAQCGADPLSEKER
ncbi:hypothetical protein PFICI_07616 [Pestalotiopsis fici W106-1]|uniref:Uncharacterized protein n=1 Tax=Pestalotiopsis fici (strain W106-1 / CGMCC3.15140) TaxID=1229662 RepID=W3X3U6_PESFW|nr:uncharacterized protein PFICI_07616 [Pestalotiopsis fici W106-1]ETS80087.1 hypothetical protein PFICI_07616 [Pestalotiopsis fici W106-1]